MVKAYRSDTTKYFERLPRRIHRDKMRRCQALLENGERCHRGAICEVEGHLENEIYDGTRWVVFLLCEEHRATNDHLWPIPKVRP